MAQRGKELEGEVGELVAHAGDVHRLTFVDALPERARHLLERATAERRMRRVHFLDAAMPVRSRPAHMDVDISESDDDAAMPLARLPLTRGSGRLAKLISCER